MCHKGVRGIVTIPSVFVRVRAGRRDKTVLSPRESFDSCDGQLIARRKRVAETVTVETVTTGKWYTVGVCSGRFLVTGSKVMLGGRG